MTEKERRKLMRLRSRAAQYPQEVLRKLRNMAGVGTPSPTGRRPNVHDPLSASRPKTVQQMPGSVTVRYGTEPTMADVEHAMRMSGGNPFFRQMTQMMDSIKSRGRTQSAAVRNEVAGNALLDEVFGELRAEQQRKINDNLGRYFEGHGRLSDVGRRIQDRFTAGDAELRGVRDRTVSEIDNWGRAAEEDIREQLDLAKGQILADAAARGMSNTNLPGELRLDAEARAARELQRVSEARSDRKIRADAANTGAIVNYGQDWSGADRTDTGNLTRFIEARNDPMPDASALLQLAREYGRSGAGQGYGGALTQAVQQGSGGGGGYGGGAALSPRAGLAMQAAAGGMFGGYGGGGYQQPAPVYGNALPFGMAGDFNGDGRVDAPAVDKTAYRDSRRARARKINSAIRKRQGGYGPLGSVAAVAGGLGSAIAGLIPTALSGMQSLQSQISEADMLRMQHNAIQNQKRQSNLRRLQSVM